MLTVMFLIARVFVHFWFMLVMPRKDCKLFFSYSFCSGFNELSALEALAENGKQYDPDNCDLII